MTSNEKLPNSTWRRGTHDFGAQSAGTEYFQSSSGSANLVGQFESPQYG